MEKQKIIKRIEKLHISLIKPYWKNTKKGTNIELVKESIQKFGYNSYIIVDKENTIIAGHSRYKALKELGYEEIEVIVLENITAKEAQQYRIIDNKISESNEWDYENLKIELRQLGDIDDMQKYFFDTDLSNLIKEDIGQSFKPVDFTEIEETRAKMEEKFDSSHESIKVTQGSKSVICPSCFHEFDLRA